MPIDEEYIFTYEDYIAIMNSKKILSNNSTYCAIYWKWRMECRNKLCRKTKKL